MRHSLLFGSDNSCPLYITRFVHPMTQKPCKTQGELLSEPKNECRMMFLISWIFSVVCCFCLFVSWIPPSGLELRFWVLGWAPKKTNVSWFLWFLGFSMFLCFVFFLDPSLWAGAGVLNVGKAYWKINVLIKNQRILIVKSMFWLEIIEFPK
jgi:hypothetical protein